MPLTDFHIKRHDTRDIIAMQLEYADGSPISADITGATVRFNMKTAAGIVIVNRAPGVILDATVKVVGYQWITGDTDLVTAPGPAGAHRAEFELTFPDGTVETFPNSPPPGSDIPHIRVHVWEDIA